MRVKTGLSPALALKPTCVGKMRSFIILKRMCGLKQIIFGGFKNFKFSIEVQKYYFEFYLKCIKGLTRSLVGLKNGFIIRNIYSKTPQPKIFKI